MRILVAGATGLVGRAAATQLAAAGHTVTALARRPVGLAGVAELVVDWDALPTLPAADCAVCALGTTIRAVGGDRNAFARVDRDYVAAFATAARAAGCRQLILVSSVGADARSSNFYLRTKGEAEAAVSAAGFARIDILRPGLIIGPRADRRPGEALMQAASPLIDPLLAGPLARYRSVAFEALAKTIVRLAAADAPGRFIHESPGLAD